MMHYYAKVHRGSRRLFVRFSYDKQTIDKLKEIAPCEWSKTENAWHFEASNKIFQKIKKAYPEIGPLEADKENKKIVRKLETRQSGDCACPATYIEQLQRQATHLRGQRR